MTYLLALDQGTTSSRAIVFDETSNVVAVCQQEFNQHYPRSGWVEHDPEEIWATQLAVAEGALRASNLQPKDIAALGITNQRETVVAWDKHTSQPLYHAIVWQNRRTASFCEQLHADGQESMVVEKTGLLLDPYFSATKISWMIQNVPAVSQAAREDRLACGTIDSWLVYRLTGGQLHVTDASNASRTQLMNIHDGDWDKELLDCFGVPRSVLPDIRSSSEVCGKVHSDLPLADIPIAGIAGDQQAALFGQASFECGAAKNTYGTGCFLLKKCLFRILQWLFSLAAIASLCSSVGADPGVYEPGSDPGVGFNLVSWFNFGSSGASVWENAVQSAYDAGFDDISLSPIRFYTPGVGSIATTSSSGPELNHVAAGVARAKSLGMRVTVNPFIEPVGFSNWRGFYNPSPGSPEANTFWGDYENYLTDVAVMAEANGADSMTVGTELRAITRNSGNNANWNDVISAVDAQFTGTLGYAANWDNYNHPNVGTAIWEHAAIDYIGIDSYFQGLLSNGQADTSGAYPNATFIGHVESSWNNKLDNEILPYASARKSGAGMPVEFTEIGYLPYNRTTVTPQNSSGALDQDEQNMAFEGLMRALDGRQAAGEFLATHIWQWDMPGSAGSLWNMNPNGGNQTNNQQTAQWLSNFVSNTPPVDPPDGATQVLFSFENDLQGFFYPNFESEPATLLSRTTTTGATDGDYSLEITKPTAAWTWDTRVPMVGDQLQVLQGALTDNIDDYVLEIDVTYVAANLPGNLGELDLHVSFESDLDSWSQAYPHAQINGATDQQITVEIPLSAFELSAGLTSANLHLGFDGHGANWNGNATIYIDRIALTDTTFVVPENADFDGDGDVDGDDFLIVQQGLGVLGSGTLAMGDANGDKNIDEADVEIWRSQFGAIDSLAASSAVPEPQSFILLMLGILVSVRSRRSHALASVATNVGQSATASKRDCDIEINQRR